MRLKDDIKKISKTDFVAQNLNLPLFIEQS